MIFECFSCMIASRGMRDRFVSFLGVEDTVDVKQQRTKEKKEKNEQQNEQNNNYNSLRGGVLL